MKRVVKVIVHDAQLLAMTIAGIVIGISFVYMIINFGFSPF
jgi:hypothetical protein